MVNGYFLYFPFDDGRETRPIMNAAQEDRTHSTENNYYIRVYWQDRLVPETILTQIPFVPSSPQMLALMEKDGISKRWKDRLMGFLFFDWEFRHISNNKLKIKVEPDLNTWLNRDAKRSDSYRVHYPSRNPDKEFIA